MSKLLLATANQKKLVELQRILDASLGTSRVTLVGLDSIEDYPDVPETGLTFGENALLHFRQAGHLDALLVSHLSGIGV